eukprot:TRINITY_DN121316_c0_g1_i1.p1 TRINITY_DN121316_c0_g1~~TRINITY_DN121316_c0_g1_i1.p1  ORF type:complete len:688 (+),score=115.65 TRINITY_DN121316_c0_g1_i1:181-2244(+)
MGNSTSVVEGLCAGGRGAAIFVAPNSRNVKFSYDFQANSVIDLQKENLQTGAFGIPIGQASQRGTRSWSTVKNYDAPVSDVRACCSGRLLLRLPRATKVLGRGQTVEVSCFRLCMRGSPVYETLKTESFSHTAHVNTSGIVFTLDLCITNGGAFVFLCPRLLLVLGSGDEVCLVEDKLGPLQPSLALFADFALVDNGGKELQLDLIFRGAPHQELKLDAKAAEQQKSILRTLRTCLQEYTTLNSHVQPATVSFGYAGRYDMLLPDADVHLQNLVVSEEPLDAKALPQQQPFSIWVENGTRLPELNGSKINVEGRDARQAALVAQTNFRPNAQKMLMHPQLGLSISKNGHVEPSKMLEEQGPFWHHVNYSSSGDHADNAGDYLPLLQGEFWLSQEPVEKEHVYFQCSSTLGQALTMCIGFRFNLLDEYLKMIQKGQSSVLRDAHIPTNGVIFGVERDPRHGGLIRMFVEHRNEIIDDMVLCEWQNEDLRRTVIYHEVYDSGSMLTYRVVLVHSDGSRQTAALEIKAQTIEDRQPDIKKGASQYQLAEDPSTRFPIAPSEVRHELLPESRIFVYTAVSYEDLQGELKMEALSELPENSRPAYQHSARSDTTFEDWHSACGPGGGTWSEEDSELANEVNRLAGEGLVGEGLAGEEEDPLEVSWRRPLIESAYVLTGVKERPFYCNRLGNS